MTVREVYLGSLIEINKVQAPALLREDFIYILNKAIMLVVGDHYRVYEETQQLTDNLRVLTSHVDVTDLTLILNSTFKASYNIILPSDYLHILNCTAFYDLVNTDTTCGIKDADRVRGVKRMTSQMYSGLINNYYQKPSHKNPYFYMRNAESVTPIEPIDKNENPSPVNLEIIYGNDTSKFTLTEVKIDYLKIPKYVDLTEDELDADEDNSQIMEFPYYMCIEIIKKLVALLMENASDPRLQTNIPINQPMPVQGVNNLRRGR